MTVSAECYQVRTYEGMMDFVRGGGQLRKEIFIPSLLVTVNGGTAFSCQKARAEGKITRIELPIDLAEHIFRAAQLQTQLQQAEKELKKLIEPYLS